MEKKLDDVLGWFKTKKEYSGYSQFNFKEFDLKADEFFKIVYQLYKDGYILSASEESIITAQGIIFINEGGYTGKKKREQEAHQSIISQTQFSKGSFWISIIAILIALISLALQFLLK